MSLFSFFHKTKKHFAIILIFAVFLPTVYFSFPQKASAFGPVVEVGPNLWTDIKTTIESTFTTIQTHINTILHISDHTKTFVLDPLAMMMAKIIIQDITASTVKWINTGFKGNPAFVQNPEQFFLNVGDQTAATYLSTSNEAWANLVCSPFSAKIRLALVQNYLSTKEPVGRCSIQSIVKNWTNFGTNFYANGGWDGWFSMTQNDSNNPVGSYMQQKDALLKSIQTRQNHYQAQLTMGNGFLSWETCKPAAEKMGPQPVAGAATGETGTCYTGTAANTTVTKTECDAITGIWTAPPEVDTSDAATPTPSPTDCPNGTQVNTPGSVIAGQLGITLGSPLQQLGVAQSINQIVGALMTQMVKQVVGGLGGGGLSGLSQSSAATQSLQAQLQTNATPGSPQFTAVQNQITSDDQNTTANSTAADNPSVSGPSITLLNPADGSPNGSDQNNPMVWNVGTAWQDPGYTAADATDGNLNNKVVISGDIVDVNIKGKYILMYNVTNSQGIPAPTVTRTVQVQ